MKRIMILAVLLVSCAHAKMEKEMTDKIVKCPSSPNCVVSLYPEDQKHYIEPLKGFTGSIDRVAKVLEKEGLEVVKREENYIHATATSSLFKFVDDIQVELKGSELHFRSASRTGYYDFGVNRKRIEKLKKLLTK